MAEDLDNMQGRSAFGPDAADDGTLGAAEPVDAHVLDAPAPPAAPRVTKDYRDLSEDVAKIRAEEAERARIAKRNRIAALGIAVAGVLLVAAGAVGALLLTHAPESDEADNSSPTVESQPAEGEASSAEGGAQQASSGTGVSAVEEVVASDQINASFAALAANEDGIFTDFVRMFMDDYDRGVNTSSSYTLAGLGIQADELSDALLSGFSCSVTEVDIQGNTAWVSVEVTSKSLADQADAFARAVESGVDSAQDEASYKEFLKQAYLDAFDGVSPRSHTLLVTVGRTAEGWPVGDDAVEYILGSVWYTSA